MAGWTRVGPQLGALAATGHRLVDRAASGVVTRLGLGVMVAAVAALAFGWALGWAEFLLAGVVLLVVLCLSALFLIGDSELDVRLSVEPARLVAGERAVGEIQVSNPGTRRMIPLQVEVPVGDVVARFPVPSLGPGGTHEEVFLMPTQKRAVIRVGPASSLRADPLGLFSRTMELAPAHDVVIHARTTRLDSLRTGLLRDLEGRTTDDLSVSDVAFHTLREYVPGDDRRHVHWRSSARLGTLMVRQFVDTRLCNLSITLETEASSYRSEEEFELAVSIAASVARRAITDEHSISIVVGRRRLPASTTVRMMDSFSGINSATDPAPISLAAGRSHRAVPDASVAVLVIGGLTTAAQTRAAAKWWGANTSVVVLRAASGETGGTTSGYRSQGGHPIVEVGQLDDLRPLLRRRSVL